MSEIEVIWLLAKLAPFLILEIALVLYAIEVQREWRVQDRFGDWWDRNEYCKVEGIDIDDAHVVGYRFPSDLSDYELRIWARELHDCLEWRRAYNERGEEADASTGEMDI